jgi:hypothetical protein
MEKIILRNWENGTKFTDYFDQSDEFDITNGVAYLYGDHIVSAKSAHARGFSIDPKFKLPGNVTNRIECGLYVQSVLGLDRQKNSRLYFETWKVLADGLPHGIDPNIGKNENNNR